MTLDVEETELGGRVGLDSDLVGAGEAGVAIVRRVAARRLEHPLEREVPERVGAEIPADLVDVVAGADQLLARRRVDAVLAGPLAGRRGAADVDPLGPASPDHLPAPPAGR